MKSQATSVLKPLPKNAETMDKQNYNSENDIMVESEEITIERKGIFSIVREGSLFFVALKNNRVSEMYTTREDALQNCENITWERITQVILILTGKEDLFKQQ